MAIKYKMEQGHKEHKENTKGTMKTDIRIWAELVVYVVVLCALRDLFNR